MLIIYAHPNKKGHCGYILEQVKKRLDKKREKYKILDLYQMKYDPLLKDEEHYTSGSHKVSKNNKIIQKKIKKSKKLIFIYPTWWNNMPAILKGFVDRVFIPKFAFSYKGNFPIGLLKGLANVYINKEGPTSANLNEEITYTLTYGNNGNIDADNVVISDTLDSNLTFVSATVNNPTTTSPDLVCNQDPVGTVICNSNGTQSGSGVTLPLGTSDTIEITATVNNDTDLLVNNTIIPNTTNITTSTNQTNLLDDNDYVETQITPNALSAIQGEVFEDLNQDVVKDDSEISIIGVPIFLAGQDIYSNIYGPNKDDYPFYYEELMNLLNLNLFSTDPYPNNYIVVDPSFTIEHNSYSFAGLHPGDYYVLEEQPESYQSTGSTAGTIVNSNPNFISGLGSIQGHNDQNQIILISLGENQLSFGNNFGERAVEEQPESLDPPPIEPTPTPIISEPEEDDDDDDDDDDDETTLAKTGTPIIFYLIFGVVVMIGAGAVFSKRKIRTL